MRYALLLVALSAYAEDGFKPLFNGKSLEGWRIDGQKGRGYLAGDGNLLCPADGGGNLYYDKEFTNFVFRFDFRMQENGNNGVGIRTPGKGHAATLGMEIQILDNDGPQYKGKLKSEQYHGSVYGIIPARTGFLKKTGEWNSEEIVADGRRIKVTLNGVVILDADLDMVREPEILKTHPGLARKGGFIGFLGHSTRVEFRDIRIKELP